MGSRLWLARVAACAGTLVIAGCPDEVDTNTDTDDDQGTGGMAGSGATGGVGGAGNGGIGGVPGPSTSDKVDLLVVVDNSRSMLAKQQLLAESVPTFIADVVAAGVRDMHIGIVSSSLGGLGADACQGSSSPTENDAAHLISRTSADGSSPPVATYQNLGFLAWDPDQALSPPGESSEAALSANFAAMVTGAGEVGCGYESQLEAFYRFLVDPDPYESIVIENNLAQLVGTDQVLLEQRAAFLRPDSLLVVVVATDENDCSTRDGGQFYFARQIYQPGTNNPYHLPPARAACAADPASDCCKSCGQAPGDGCDESADQCGGSLSALEDNINLRCFDQKRRFGIDFNWPIDRYVAGLNAAQVADRAGNVVPNPIYAAGGRGSELVVLAGMVGVPWQLLDANPAEAARTAEQLDDEGRWPALVGDLSSFTTPTDAHMVESIEPRGGLAPPSSPHDADPFHGHELSTPNRDDLQYACTFALPQPIDCTASPGVCPCLDPGTDSPLCQDPATNLYGTIQFASSAYPSTRPLTLLRAMGGRGVVGSICPAEVTDTTAPSYGHRPTLSALFEVLAARIE
jgi:hypothetical protein